MGLRQRQFGYCRQRFDEKLSGCAVLAPSVRWLGDEHPIAPNDSDEGRQRDPASKRRSCSAAGSSDWVQQSYQVYKSGSYIAFVETTNVTSGSVNLLEFFSHIIAKRWISSTSTLGAIDCGVELVSTGGVDATFAVNGFSLTATN